VNNDLTEPMSKIECIWKIEYKFSCRYHVSAISACIFEILYILDTEPYIYWTYLEDRTYLGDWKGISWRPNM